MDDEPIRLLASQVIAHLRAARMVLATAESCTGGWVAKAITDIAGSSDVFGCGYVTYSNKAKSAMLGVAQQTLRAHGAVSKPVVREMAQGALERGDAGISVAVSGIAGPDGGVPGKPVGTVWFAWCTRNVGGLTIKTDRQVFDGDRDAVRRAAVLHALEGVLERA